MSQLLILEPGIFVTLLLIQSLNMKLYRAICRRERRRLKIYAAGLLALAVWYLLSGSRHASRQAALDCSPSGVTFARSGETGADGEYHWTEVDKTRNLIGCPVQWPDFVEFGGPNSPGEGGRPFQFGQADLTREQWRQKEQDFTNHYFDQWVSRRISVRRFLPDVRSTDCLGQRYQDLPPASIVINFCNEEWSTLLRTLHSVLDRTPGHLLKEIILIDDFSSLDYLHLPLEVYLQPIKKIRLVRSSRRLGLIEARNLGSRLATAEVVIFLDSHIECFPGWIEPLLWPIKNNETAVVFPIIPLIDKHTFGIHQSDAVPLGSMSLSTLQFTWLPEGERPPGHKEIYVESPTMPGGLYAVSRSWFTRLGSYDPQLVGWGGENIEMSLKTWMCGGSLKTTKCSRVAHVYRDMSPVSWPNHQEVTRRNSYRVAEVWMDGHKHYFYERNAYSIGDIGDVSQRLDIRQSLKCQSFDWYLNNVLPELKKEIADSLDYNGQMKNVGSGLCLQSGSSGNLASLEPCLIDSTPQVWRFMKPGQFWNMNSFLGFRAHDAVGGIKTFTVETFSPKVAQNLPVFTWKYQPSKQLQNNETSLCLGVDPAGGRRVHLAPCVDSDNQKWEWQTRDEFRAIHRQRALSISWDA